MSLNFPFILFRNLERHKEVATDKKVAREHYVIYTLHYFEKLLPSTRENTILILQRWRQYVPLKRRDNNKIT
jgi:hypothetical protein